VEGIRRSRASLERAELILHVLDRSEPLTKDDETFLREFTAKKRVIVRNKIDLPPKLEMPPAFDAPTVDVSCTTGAGIDELKDEIRKLVWAGEVRAEMLEVMINSRHQDALRRAREATLAAIKAMTADESLEFVALELRIAVSAIGEVVGKTTTEDLLDQIFSQFCIGK
jgi:tRNA modification GTPase